MLTDRGGAVPPDDEVVRNFPDFAHIYSYAVGELRTVGGWGERLQTCGQGARLGASGSDHGCAGGGCGAFRSLPAGGGVGGAGLEPGGPLRGGGVAPAWMLDGRVFAGRELGDAGGTGRTGGVDNGGGAGAGEQELAGDLRSCIAADGVPDHGVYRGFVDLGLDPGLDAGDGARAAGGGQDGPGYGRARCGADDHRPQAAAHDAATDCDGLGTTGRRRRGALAWTGGQRL